MIAWRRIVGMLLSATLACASAAYGQDGSADEPFEGSQGKPYGATIEIQNNGPIAYGDPVFVSIRMTPLEDITIQSINLIPQGELASLYGVTTKTEDGEEVAKWPCTVGIMERPRGLPFSVSCEIRPDFKMSRYFRSEVLMLPSSRHKVLVKTEQMINGNAVEYYDEVFVDVRPTKASVMVGALVGALVLSLFFGIYRDPKDPPVRAWKDVVPGILVLPFYLIDTLRSALLASVCALILILLADVSEGGTPPISLQVEDFWGGAIVGLFSVPLARWIATRLAAIGK